MSVDIKPLPDGFLSKLLGEFGLQWTHLVILSGVVFSSFELQQYLNPGIWILGTVGSFSVVYLFRYQITGSFPKTAAYAGSALMIAVLAPWIALMLIHRDVGSFIENWTKLSTMYLAVVIGVPVGMMILSYRAQGDSLRTTLPAALETGVKAVSQSDFIHESVNCVISLRHGPNSGILLRFDVTMNVVNRLPKAALYQDYFDPAGRDKRFMWAEINGKQVNYDDPDRVSQRGLILTHKAGSHEKFRIVVSGESTFHASESELVGVYFPCCALSIKVSKPPDDLRVHVLSLLREKVDAKRLDTGDLLFEYSEGILPFQGARLFWTPRDETPGSGVMV